MLNANCISIIDLLHSMQRYFTSYEIAEHIGKSVRTVKRDIEDINSQISAYDMQIISRKKLGYRLDIKDENQYRSFLTVMGSSFNDLSYETEYKQKLLEHFLFADSPQDQFSLSELIFLNETSLHKVIKSLNKDLEPFKAKIQRCQNGYLLQADETSRRCLFLELLSFNYHFRPENKDYSENYISLFQDPRHDEIRTVIINTLTTHNIHPFHFLLDKITNYLILAENRIAQGSTVRIKKGLLDPMIKTVEFSCSRQILDLLYPHTSDEEAVLFTAMIMSCENTKYATYQTNRNPFLKEAETICTDIISLTKIHYGLDLCDFRCFYESMVSILIPVICGNRFSIMNEVSFSKTKRIMPHANDPLARDMMTRIFRYLQRTHGYSCSLQMLSQILNIFMGYLMEIDLDSKKIDLCISTDLNVNYKRKMIDPIIKRYEEHFNQIHLINFYEINRFLNRSEVFCVELRYLERYHIPLPVYYYETATLADSLNEALKDAVLHCFEIDHLAKRFADITTVFTNISFIDKRNAGDIISIKYGNNDNIDKVRDMFYENKHINDENINLYFFFIPRHERDYFDFYRFNDKNNDKKTLVVCSMDLTCQEAKTLQILLLYLNENASVLKEIFEGGDTFKIYRNIIGKAIRKGL